MPIEEMKPINENDPAFAALYRETRERAMELGERKGLPEEVLHQVLDSVTDPGRFADLVAGYVELPVAEKQALLETLGVEERLRRVLIHVQKQIGMLAAQAEIKSQVQEELGERQREMFLREQMQGDPEGAGRGRPEPRDQRASREAEQARAAPRGADRGRARARPARTRRARVDGSPGHPHLPRVGRRASLEHPLGRSARPEPCHRGARRGPLRPAGRQGPGARVPGRAPAPRPATGRGGREVGRMLGRQAQGRQGHGHAFAGQGAGGRPGDHRLARGQGAGHGQGPDPALRRPAGRGQDVDRQVDRPVAGAEVRPRGPGRRPRRGRHPRPPPHLRRRHARPDHPGNEAGRHQEPRLPARRGRQARRLVPGRPGQRTAGSARPGPERHVHRPLPERAVRPQRGPLHRHGQLPPEHPRPAPGPHGGRRLRRLHRAREGRDRQEVPDPPPARGVGAVRPADPVHRRGGDGDRQPVHPGKRRPPARAADRRGDAEGRTQAGRRRADRPDARARDRPRAAGPAQGPSRACRRGQRGRRGHGHVLHPGRRRHHVRRGGRAPAPRASAPGWVDRRRRARQRGA